MSRNKAKAARVRSANRAVPTTKDWYYSGDVNCEYGGVWIDLSTWSWGYCSVVRVDDLDDCSFPGACCIEHLVVFGWDNSDHRTIKGALASCNPEFTHWRVRTRRTVRAALVESLLSYGSYDPDSGYEYMSSIPQSEVVQLDPLGPMHYCGTKATKRLHNTTLRAYIESVHLK